MSENRFRRVLLVSGLAGAVFLTGCATTGGDTEHEARVKNQGTGAGALVGGILGAVIGGRRGAVIGAALGAGAGRLLATDVAKRQAQYENRESLIEGETEYVAQVLHETKTLNDGLRVEFASLDNEVNALSVKYRKGQATKIAMANKKKEVQAKHDSAKTALEKVEKEYELAEEMLAEAKTKGGDGHELAEWKAKVEALEAERGDLKAMVGELVAMSDSMAF